MKFGIFSIADHYPAELGRSVSCLYEELLEQVCCAERSGFDSFWVAEHHFHEYGAVPRPPIWLAAAAQRTKRIRLGSAVVVLPFDNPMRTAEDYAMVDVLSDGRLNLGVGSGYLAHEYAGFGVDPQLKRERFDESLEVLLQAWKGERFSFNGTFINIDQVQLNVVPVQKPRPPVWIAALRSEAAGFVAARGMPVMLIPYATTEQFEELSFTAKLYADKFESNADCPPLDPSDAIVFGLHAHCAESDEQAVSEASEPMERYVRTRLYARQRPLEELIKRDLVAFGSPDEIVRIARRYEQIGLQHFLAIANFGGMAHEKVLRSIELMGKYVLTQF